MAVNSINNNSALLESPVKSLSYKDRPDSLKIRIDMAFNHIVKNTSSEWGYFNGGTHYDICEVDEHKLLDKIIEQAPKSKKVFRLLEIGAGNFQWSACLAKYIANKSSFHKDVTVEIYSVRGEKYLGDPVVKTDRCIQRFFGAFKVENLLDEFKRNGCELENSFDLIASRWCMRHLADPVGTFQQAMQLLSKDGFFLGDGWFLLDDESHTLSKDANHNHPITQLFLDTKLPFITRFYDGLRSLNHFVLQRSNETPCALPWRYVGESFVGDGWQVGSSNVTRFVREPQKEDSEAFETPGNQFSNYVYGDKKLHEWLKQNALFCSPNTVWRSLKKKNEGLGIPELHSKIKNCSLEEFREVIEDCRYDINESDLSGCTPLHIAVKFGAYDKLELLLKKQANVTLADGEDYTPLHLAAIHDKDGKFIQALIKHGANIDEDFRYKKTPLSCALKHKNVEAAATLIKAGAKISDSDHIVLEDSVFLPLHKEGLIPPKIGSGGLQDLYSWIKRGDCVVLHYNGVNGMMYYFPKSTNPYPRLIVVNVDPDTNLLDQSEWPDAIKKGNEGFEFAPYNYEIIKNGNFLQTYQYNFPAVK